MVTSHNTVTYTESVENLFTDDLPNANALRAAYRLGYTNGSVNAYKHVIACLTDADTRRALQDRLQVQASGTVLPDDAVDDGTDARK